jgi:hypothetical protein
VLHRRGAEAPDGRRAAAQARDRDLRGKRMVLVEFESSPPDHYTAPHHDQIAGAKGASQMRLCQPWRRLASAKRRQSRDIPHGARVASYRPAQQSPRPICARPPHFGNAPTMIRPV